MTYGTCAAHPESGIVDALTSLPDGTEFMTRLEKLGVSLGLCVLLIVLVAPVFTYAYTFGWHISSASEEWSRMGSAMSGVYGPILTVLTVFLLARQIYLQWETNTHTFDQAHIQQADANVAFYLDRLEKALNSHDANGKRSRDLLESSFMNATRIAELETQPAVATSTYLNRRFPEVFAAWSAFQAIISGLEAGEGHLYRLSLTSAKQRAIVVLSFGTCVTLDNYCWCLHRGGHDVPYVFSPLFNDD